MTDTTAPPSIREMFWLDRAVERFKFTGDAKTYFGIWVANVTLSVVTLGAYLAWAKVRRRQYFYGNTNIESFPLIYHASGLQLFKGRVLVFLAIATYSTTSYFWTPGSVILLVAFVFLYPWLVNRSLRFNGRMTSWKNVRLNWRGTYWKSLWFFALFPILAVSVGLWLLPAATKLKYEYYARHHSFGTLEFNATPRYLSFYIAFLYAALPIAAAGAASFVAFALFGQSAASYALIAAMLALALVAALVIYAIGCRNALVRTLTLGDSVRFRSTINPLTYSWIIISNIIAVALSLGFLIPWASVRKYSYLSKGTKVQFKSDDLVFRDEQTERVGAFAQEFADIEGFEISI